MSSNRIVKKLATGMWGPASEDRSARWAVRATGLIAVLCALALGSTTAADAYCVYNETTHYEVRVSVYKSDGVTQVKDSVVLTPKHGDKPDDCANAANFGLGNDELLIVIASTATWQAEIGMHGAGTAYIHERARDLGLVLPEKIPEDIWIESFAYNSTPDNPIKTDDSFPAGFEDRTTCSLAPAHRSVRFLVTGDTQYWDDPQPYVDDYNNTADRVMETMSDLLHEEGSPRVRGILIAGDLTQGSKIVEYANYLEATAESRWFVFEGWGNHDIDEGLLSQRDIIANLEEKKRNTIPTAPPRPHYSWDWHDVHFAQLNLFPGDGIDHGNVYKEIDPLASLTFLKNDLEAHVGNTGRPVVLIHHYGFDSFSTGRNQANETWWTEEQREEYWNAIKDYNVIGIFTGHVHLGSTYKDEELWVRKACESPEPLTDPACNGRPFNFIAGAARGTGDHSTDPDNPVSHQDGVFLDVLINSSNEMIVRRKDLHGEIVGEGDDAQQIVSFTAPDLTGDEDNQPPIPDASELPTVTGECSATIVSPPTATDSFGNTVLGTTSDPLAYTTPGTHTVTWVFEDGCGNTASQTQTVVVTDNAAPVPDLAQLPTVTGECSATVEAPTATDACGGPITGSTSDPTTYSTQGTYTVTWTFDDGNGNTSTQTQTVEVDDVTAPTPDATSLPKVTGQCSATVASEPTASDNCGGAVSVATEDALSYADQGSYTVTWTFDDGNGNTSTQTQTVEVKDTMPPTISPPAASTLECGVDSYLEPGATATDACDGEFAATVGGETVDPSTVGTYVVTYDAKDAVMNAADQASVVVTVSDTETPIIALFGDAEVTLQCGIDSYGEAGAAANDSCDQDVAVSIGGAVPDPSLLGLYDVTYDAVDDSQNAATQVVRPVTVVDTIAPVISTCPPDRELLADPASGLATMPDLVPEVVASDSCNLAVSQDIDAGEPLGSGSHVVTITASDGVNTSHCTVILTALERFLSSEEKAKVHWHDEPSGDDGNSEPESESDDPHCFTKLDLDGRLQLRDPAALPIDVREAGELVDARVAVELAGFEIADQAVILEVKDADKEKWEYKRPGGAEKVGVKRIKLDWHEQAEYDSHEGSGLGSDVPQIESRFIGFDETDIEMRSKDVARPFTVEFADGGQTIMVTVLDSLGNVLVTPAGDYNLKEKKDSLEMVLPFRLTPQTAITYTDSISNASSIPVDPEVNYVVSSAKYFLELDQTAISEALCGPDPSLDLNSLAPRTLEIEIRLGSGLSQVVGAVEFDPAGWDKTTGKHWEVDR